MVTLFSRIALICSMFLLAAACGDDDDNTSGNEDGVTDAGPMDAGREDSAVSDENEAETGADDSGTDADAEAQPTADGQVQDADGGEREPPEPRCGDGILQEEKGEECDDGNFFENDGCTALCEFECQEDSDCDNGDLCDGEEACNAQNICENGPDAEDGEACGLRKNCFGGFCRDDVCGDTLVNEEYLGEECDDGNAIDDDGCTTECRFTCTSNSDCEGGDPCAGTRTCNTDEHTCAGEPLDDEAACSTEDLDDGWCQGGVCVPTDCGDGIWVEGTAEECDLGQDNGKPGSGCSRDCRVVVCGDGTIQGDEQCDDGNDVNLDGCDRNCRAEVFVRWTRFHVLAGAAPDWCVYANNEADGNQFAEAFAGSVTIPVGPTATVEVELLQDIVNEQVMESVFESCEANAIVHISGLDDISFSFSDDEVELAGYAGELGPMDRCSNPMRADTGFVLNSEGLDENNGPAQVVPVIQRPRIIRTKEPITISEPEGASGPAVGTLTDLMLQVPVDTETLSTPPDMADSVQVPEEFGFGDRNTRPYRPAGIACFAMDPVGIAELPILPIDEDFYSGGPCCRPAAGGGWEHYDTCAVEGDVVVETPGETCDSMLELFITGCTLCVNPGEDAQDLEKYWNCGGCVPENQYEVLRPTPLDVDTDGDGEPNAYSMVVGLEGKRIRSLGVED